MKWCLVSDLSLIPCGTYFIKKNEGTDPTFQQLLYQRALKHGSVFVCIYRNIFKIKQNVLTKICIYDRR